jgi:hypothetical protein
VNCLVAGRPGGTALAVAGAFLAAAPEAPVTLLSDDTDGLLRAVEQPGLDRCEVLWADAAVPATLDDALVHRRMLHGRPDVVVVVIDRERGTGDLVAVLAPRLGGAPLLVTGDGAAARAQEISALLAELAVEQGSAPVHVVVPGHDLDAVLRGATELVRSAPQPAVPPAPLLSGHCAH